MEVRDGYTRTDAGLIPRDWHVLTLEAIATISSGTTPSRARSERYFHNGQIPWVKTLDLNNSVIRSTDEQVTAAAVSETSLQIYPPGSVLVAMYGGYNQIGRTGLLAIPATVNQALTAIRPDPRRLNSGYLLRVLNHRIGFWRSVASSTRKDPNLTGRDIAEFVLAVPPKAEQEAIDETLGDTDALIESLEQLLAKKRQIKQGAMQDLLTGVKRLQGFSGNWTMKRLGELAEVVMGQSPSSDHYNSEGRGLPLIQGNADIANRRTITRVFTTEITRLGRVGDTLVSVRAPVGEVSRAVSEVCLGRGVCAIRYPNDFLYYALILKEPAWRRLSKGTTFESVTSADVKALEIEVAPTEAEQRSIAGFLSDIDGAIDALEARVAKARQLKQGMMQELLTGRIRLIGSSKFA